MLLKIATTHQPATDLGYLLRKNPANVHRADHAFGRSVLFFPEASDSRCEAALMLEVDPIQLVRGRPAGQGDGLLAHYVNDRPYAASSFLSVTINRVLRDAMAGRAKEREELAGTAIPLELEITPLPCRGDNGIIARLFEPLGYEVESETVPLDPAYPEWGESPYRTVRLKACIRLADALTHLYVLIPVLDNAKHYWVGSDEVEKLIAKAERELIARRYLRQRQFAQEALSLLDEQYGQVVDEPADERASDEEQLEKPMRLNDLRYEAIAAILVSKDARRVCDLGCGEGRLLRRLMQEKSIEYMLGIDVSTRELEKAGRRLHLERMPPTQRARIDVVRGSLVYDDARMQGFDAITLIEVIEHVDAERLDALERVVFGHARPGHVLVSTPNIEFNQTFENLEPGRLRHSDHRFEWTRSEFQDWANAVCERQGYTVAFDGIGEPHPSLGPPTQLAVFTRGGES